MTQNIDRLPLPDVGIRCMKCRHPLAGASGWACPNCGHAFTLDEHTPPGDFPVVILDGQEVKLTPAIADLLNTAGIPHMAQTGAMEAIYGVARPTWEPGRLAVPRSRYFEAIELLQRHPSGTTPQPQPQSPAPDWTCPACGERNPATFDVCWNCSSRDQQQ